MTEFKTLEKIANHLKSNTIKKADKNIEREKEKKKIVVEVIFAHNGVGKTRLSGAFKELATEKSDTLYFNAFTEDLFHWDNDLEHNTTRVLQLKESKFFKVFEGSGFDIETRVREFLSRYADFDFSIDLKAKKVSFSREIIKEGKKKKVEDIKISRGEENIFVWSFFLAIAGLAIDNDENYKWVKTIYIDDPISSLDDNNVITVASHLAQLIKDSKDKDKKFIISTHHGLFYNVIVNELRGADKYLLTKNGENYKLEVLKSDTPFYQHIGILKYLRAVAQSGEIYTYHFNLLRNVLEKTAAFHGFDKFSDCIKDGADKSIHERRINMLSHGNYSIFEPQEMVEENKNHFKAVLEGFIEEYGFNPQLFPNSTTKEKPL
jgi:wobble nucleotide-excising tRNase